MEQDIPTKVHEKCSKKKGRGRGVGALGSDPTGASQDVASLESQGLTQVATPVLGASGTVQVVSTAGQEAREDSQGVTAVVETQAAVQGASSLESHGPAQSKKSKGRGRGIGATPVLGASGAVQVVGTAGQKARGDSQGATAVLETGAAAQGASSIESHGPAQSKKSKGRGRGIGSLPMEAPGAVQSPSVAESHEAMQGAKSSETPGQTQGKKGKKKGKGRGMGAPISESQATPEFTISEPHKTIQGSSQGAASLEHQAAVQIPQVTAPSVETNQPANTGSKKGKKKKGGQKGKAAGGAEALPETMAALKVDESSKPSDKGPNFENIEEPVIRQILATRPNTAASKVGKNGDKITLTANYYELTKTKDWKLVLYHVYFSPDEERTRERKRLLRLKREYLGDGYLFDGMQLYLNRMIGSPTTVKELDVVDDTTTPPTKYTIYIKFIKELQGNDVLYLQLMNIILRRCQDHLGLKLLGRNFYDPKRAIIKHEYYNVTIWPGYSTSIREFERSLLLNVDVSHKFIRNQTALEMIREHRSNEQVQAAIVGIVVMTLYNEKSYRVDDIDFTMNPRSTFAYRGENTSYITYYQQRYNLTIKDERQPLLMSRPKKRDIRRGMTGNIYLVPELCTVTGLSERMRSDFNFMKSLAEYTRMTPDARVAALNGLNSSLATTDSTRQELAQWGLRLERNLIQLEGRVLPAVTLYQNGEMKYEQKSGEWTNVMRSRKLNNPKDMINWAVVYPWELEASARSLCDNLRKAGGGMGMNINMPAIYPLDNDRTTTYIQCLSGNCAGKQIILVLLSKNFGDKYGAIKKHLSVNMAVPSQCVLARTLQNDKRLMSIATKIVIQMNCKLGGDVWKVQVPNVKIMIIGYDTYHDTQSRGSSFGAVVSSLNLDWTRYYGQVARHANQEELTNKFGIAVTNALSQFLKENNCLPQYVLVYRDGVGDGQVGYVRDHEVAAIQNCFDTIGLKAKWAFIIVSKRISTRLFVRKGKVNENPTPGTVVDDVITLPERYDFFLVPQKVTQGTVTPTSFNVIHDTTGITPDMMQNLAYKLTHLYYNWQGTVRVPAPCLYAHKLAYITGTAIHEPAHPSIATKLWYL